MRRLANLGVLTEGENKLDVCLGLTLAQFLERRLQTRVFKAGYAKSIHHARCLIKQRHIRYVAPLLSPFASCFIPFLINPCETFSMCVSNEFE
jgi:hypothetical protein